MQIKIAICDDEQLALQAIRDKVIQISEQLNMKPEMYTYNNGRNLLEAIQRGEEQFSLLLLDIDMPEISGIKIAEIIRETDENQILIFISAHEQYVFEAIEYSPFRYIRKNRLGVELPLALKAAYAKLEAESVRSMIVKTDDGKMLIYPSQIMYCETESRKLKIHLNTGKQLMVWKTIKEFMKEMEDERFIQLHSGSVVNARYIKEFSNFDITLDNEEHLIVSRRRVKEVKTELLKYWRNQI